MNRRRFALVTTALGTAAGGSSPGSAQGSAQDGADVFGIDAVGADLPSGDEVDLRPGVTITFAGVGEDDRCPADLDCEVPGSAAVALRLVLEDERQNQRSLDVDVVIPLRRWAIAFDNGQILLLAALSGDRNIARDELTLSLVLLHGKASEADA